MKILRQAILFSSLWLFQVFSLPVLNSYGLKKLVVFGDSLSDNGNCWRITNHTWPSDPAYFRHTFTNGPLWVDYLADKLGLELEDYAVGGATSDNSVVQGFTGQYGNITVPSLIDQYESYSGNHQIKAENLYVILIGANDILLGYNIDGVIPAVSKVIQDLHGKGASDIVIGIPPDVGRLPYRAFVSTDISETLSSLSKDLRTSLINLQTHLSRFDFRAPLLDLYSLFDAMISRPESFGFSAQKTNISCLVGAYGETPHRTLCSDPEQYIFWDEYHPTTHAGAYISLEALTSLNGNIMSQKVLRS